MSRRSKGSPASEGDSRSELDASRTRPVVPLFQRISSLAEGSQRERIGVSELFNAMQEGAVVALVLLFALPNGVPMPPGTSAVLATPLLFLTIEWMLGTSPWLPRLLTRRSLPRTTVVAISRRASHLLSRTDRLLTPRLQILCGPLARRLIAGLCVVLATLILLPIPFGNMPPAWAIILIALGMLRRDGLWILAGIATGLLSIALAWEVAVSLLGAAAQFFPRSIA